jgi:hypothetical protein
MLEYPELGDFELLLDDGLERSRSAFEQYFVLYALNVLIDRLDDEDRMRLAQALNRQRSNGGWIKPGTDRWGLSESMLRKLGPSVVRVNGVNDSFGPRWCDS